MKLRIRGNSLRLRLGRAEVDALVRGGSVGESVRFGPGQALRYTLACDAQVATLAARFEAGEVRVLVPTEQARAWAGSDSVRIEHSQPVEGDEPLRLLVEKDFACLAPRVGEGDEEAFAHPLAGKKGSGC